MILFLCLLFTLICPICFAQNKIGNVEYRGAFWDINGHGNHRAVIKVSEASDYNKVRIIWRRHDAFPENISIIIEDQEGNRVKEYYETEKNNIYCDLIFRPQSGPGTYYVYYMPFSLTAQRAESEYFNERYDFEFYNLGPADLRDSLDKDYPKAEHIAIEYRETIDHPAFNSMYPMEVVASKEEVRDLIKNNKDQKILIFPEDREHPIKMTDYVPLRWTEKGTSLSATFTGAPKEYFVFQLGAYATENIKNLKIEYKNISSFTEDRISENPDAITCFNTEGINQEGKYFTKNIDIEKGKVQALWFGIGLPKKECRISFTASLSADGIDPIPVNITVNVQGNIKEDRGMDDKDTLARLSWLNTYIGDEDIPLPPYTPVEVKDNKISILDRDITLGEDGLPLSITSRGNEILASPITFDIITEEKSETSSSQLLQENQGLTFADFVSKTDNPFFEITTKTKTECEGCITFSVTLKAKKHIETEDISLSIPVRKEIAEYMIGFGRQGGFRKGNIKWKWNKSRCDYRFWTGNTEAGIHLDLRHSHDTWDQYFNYHFGNPPSWDNEGLGGAEVTERENDVLIKAFSGARTFEENEICEFNFRLHITPFHRQIENHWDYSYTYSGKQTSAHYAHQHHADPCYPYINYPFFFMDRMKTKFEEYRKHFKGVNLYYTCREMSVHAPELWAFESLNYEIYEDGKELENTQKEIFLTLFGGKCAWLKEHLSIDCHPEWRSVLEQDEFDPAIGTLPVSRLSNFYIKGLDYILDKVPFDGVYIDTVKYSRSTMRRLAQVLYKKLGYARINLHTYNMYNHFDTRTSPIVQYMEHLPYMTTLWLGEEADYDRKPDHWLVEHSGIPFGLTSEELFFSNNPNQYRGMVFGMGSRTYENANELWDFWYDYGMKDTEMTGYWQNPPVTSGCEDIPVTCYTKEKECLIAIASWSDKDEEISLHIDFERLGIDLKKAEITAPYIKGFQEETVFGIGEKIPVPKGKGWLLILK